jgi:uncharacterized membrane protein YkoI
VTVVTVKAKGLSMRRIIALVLIGHLATAAAQAAPKTDREPPRRGVSSDQAASTVRSVTGGKVLGVRGGKQEGDNYSVKVLLPDGRVRTLRVDARTGQVSD